MVVAFSRNKPSTNDDRQPDATLPRLSEVRWPVENVVDESVVGGVYPTFSPKACHGEGRSVGSYPGVGGCFRRMLNTAKIPP